MTAATVDVRNIEPRERHPMIFEKLDQLEAGESLTIFNDHDPMPLKYQLEAQRPDQYRWEYIESGPEQWQVEIVCRAHIVDARPTLAAGGEPFTEIMDAAAQVEDDQILVVYAPFEPVPLQGALGEQGFQSVTDQLDEKNWRVTFAKV